MWCGNLMVRLLIGTILATLILLSACGEPVENLRPTEPPEEIHDPIIEEVFVSDALSCTYTDEDVPFGPEETSFVFDDTVLKYRNPSGSPEPEFVDMWVYFGSAVTYSLEDARVAFPGADDTLDTLQEDGCSYIEVDVFGLSYDSMLDDLSDDPEQEEVYGLLTERSARVSELADLYDLNDLNCEVVPKPSFDGEVCDVGDVSNLM